MKEIKKTSFGILLLAVTTLFFSSCSSTPDSLKAIPKDTNLVATMDIYSIASKGKLTDMSEFNFFKAFNTEVQNENKKLSKMMDDLMKDPLSSGLDLTSDFFFFLLDKKQEGAYMCFAIEVDSKEKFTQFIKDLSKEAGMPVPIEEAANYNHINFGGQVMAWDDEKLIIVSPQGYSGRKGVMTHVASLMSLEEKDQITSNENFNQFYRKSKDLNLWLSTNLMEGLPGVDMVKEQIGFDIKDNLIAAYLDFATDKISLKAEVTPNADLQKQIDEYKVLDNDFNTDLLKLFPSNAYMAMSASVNPNGYYKMLANQKSFDVMLKELQKMYPIDIKEMFESVGGNMVLAVANGESSSEDAFSLPVMGLAFDINNNKMLNELVKNLPAEAKKGENYFEMEFTPGVAAYIIYNDAICLITNDPKSIKAFKENTSYDSKHLGNSKLAKNMSSNAMYMYMDLDFSSYSEALKKQIEGAQGSEVVSMLNTWGKMAKSIEMKQINNTTSEFIFTTGDDGTNSLYKIISTVDKNLNQLAPF